MSYMFQSADTKKIYCLNPKTDGYLNFSDSATPSKGFEQKR